MLHRAPQVLRKKGLGKLVNIDGGRWSTMKKFTYILYDPNS